MAEVGLFVAVLVLPILVGAATRYRQRPWWWGAIVATVIVFIAAIAPEPEEGESRLAAGDLVFLAVVAAIASALVWLGFWLAGRFIRTSEPRAE
jgi:drug/metabolite transporter (DMT)-like permease